MRLESDDGRPETSPPLRRGVQTEDRAVVRERQAIPGDRVQDIRNSGFTRAADDRTPEQNEPVGPGRRDRQLEMEVDVSEQAAPVLARK